MDLVLIDTSTWLNFFKDVRTPACEFMHRNILSVRFATCPTVIQEVLQGIVSDKEEKLVNSFFDRLTKLEEDPYQLAIQAAHLYKYLRKQGVTIRKPNDYLIAMYAIKNNISIVHDDRDFDFIAEHSPIKIAK